MLGDGATSLVYIAENSDKKKFAIKRIFKDNLIPSHKNNVVKEAEICQKLKVFNTKLNEKLDWINEQFDSTIDLRKMTYNQSYEQIAQCLQYFDKLEFWIDFTRIRHDCCETVLKNYILKIEKKRMMISDTRI